MFQLLGNKGLADVLVALGLIAFPVGILYVVGITLRGALSARRRPREPEEIRVLTGILSSPEPPVWTASPSAAPA